MKYDILLESAGNTTSVYAYTAVCRTGMIQGVSINMGNGSIVIKFSSLTKWFFLALWFRVTHPILWLRGVK